MLEENLSERSMDAASGVYGAAEMCFAGIECSECDVFWGDVYSRGLREEVWKYACEFVVSGEGE